MPKLKKQGLCLCQRLKLLRIVCNTRASSFVAIVIDRTGSGQGFDQYLSNQINVICFSLESLIFYVLYALQFDSQKKVAKPQIFGSRT